MCQRANLFIVGASKAGTTSLADFLRRVPTVFVPNGKELQIFNNLTKKSCIRQAFEKHMKFEMDYRYWCDASPQYTHVHPKNGLMNRIGEYNEDAKLIYIVRDPLVRIHSHYLQLRSLGRKMRGGLIEAWEDHEELRYSSMYGSQLASMLRVFRRDAVLVISFEQLINETSATMLQLSEFLGIDLSGFESHSLPKSNSTISHGEDRFFTRVIRMVVPSKIIGWLKIVLPKHLHALLWRIFRRFQVRSNDLNNVAGAFILGELENELDSFLRLANWRDDPWRDSIQKTSEE